MIDQWHLFGVSFLVVETLCWWKLGHCIIKTVSTLGSQLALYSCQKWLLEKMLFHQLRAIGRNFHDIVLSSPIENNLFRGKRIRPTELRVLFESWVVMVPTVAPYLPSYWRQMRQRLQKWTFWAFSRNVSIQMSLRLVVRPRDNCEVWQDAGNCCRVGMYEFGLGGESDGLKSLRSRLASNSLGISWQVIIWHRHWTCRNELGQELQSKFGIYWKLSIKFIGMNTMPPDVSESYPIEGLKASIQSVCRWTLIRSIMILLPHVCIPTCLLKDMH